MSAKVAKAVRDVIEHTKTVTAQNITTAVSQGVLKGVPGPEVEKILTIVKASIDQAYHQSAKSVDRAIAAETGTPAKKNA